MKISALKTSFALPVLRLFAASFLFSGTARLTADTVIPLHSFTFLPDGASPESTLIVTNGILYGTAAFGGTSSNGTVFKMNIDGTGFTNLYSFTASSDFPDYKNSDGINPSAGLILLSNTLYGIASAGGSFGAGTVFSVNTDGTGFTTLHSFTFGNDGANPNARLVSDGNSLYGTTVAGGDSDHGTVFGINIDGTGFTNLHSFAGSDGAYPYAGLVLSSNILFGTTVAGGIFGQGTVFRVNRDSTGFSSLYNFTPGGNNAFNLYTNSDGANPYAELLLSGSTLYGTANAGGAEGKGTVFKLNNDGTGFVTLHSFGAINSLEAGFPYAGLILSNNTLYGTASDKSNLPGSAGSGYGALFSLNTDGSAFVNLYTFTSGSDGATPYAGLTLSGDALYGTAVGGGSSGYGTVYRLSSGGATVPGFLTITRSGTNVILSWPTSPTGFSLQSTTNLLGLSVWTPVLPAPVVVNGRNTVTNPILHQAQFYRLSAGNPNTAQLLTINRAGTNVILTWSTNALGVTLQSTTNLLTPVWVAVSPAPIVVNGLNTVTNPISGTSRFYRLR